MLHQVKWLYGEGFGDAVGRWESMEVLKYRVLCSNFDTDIHSVCGVRL
jgi:hypothetical protein